MFDSVESTQCAVYDILVKPLVEKALNGYDVSFIAIGQTGSGKTYTVGFESSVSKTTTICIEWHVIWQLVSFFPLSLISGNLRK